MKQKQRFNLIWLVSIVGILSQLLACTEEFDCTERRYGLESKLVISEILNNDSLFHFYPNIEIYGPIRNYRPRSKYEQLKPLPPPFSNQVFPEVEVQFFKNGHLLTGKDSAFIKQQEYTNIERVIDLDYTSDRPKIYYYLFKPIFSSSFTYSHIKLELYCGSDCGYSRVFILKKLEDKWTVISTETLNVS